MESTHFAMSMARRCIAARAVVSMRAPRPHRSAVPPAGTLPLSPSRSLAFAPRAATKHSPLLQDDVVIFLHDSDRPTEKRIIEDLVLPGGSGVRVEQLGVTRGPHGDLAGFRVAHA